MNARLNASAALSPSPASSSCCPGTADGTQDPAAVAAETEGINEWFEEQFEEQLAFSPIQQTMLGRKSNNDAIDDLSIAGSGGLPTP